MTKNTTYITLIIALTFIWVGLIIGISFIEAPLKFQAPNITTILGLGIGKLVFQALNIAEWIISVSILLVLFTIKSKQTIWYLFMIPIIILTIQSLWLLPILMQRADLVINHQELPNGYYHIYYIISDGLKFLFIIRAGVVFTKKSVEGKLY